MTKAEQQQIENLQRELREAKALRWSGFAMPERMQVPKAGYVDGWIERTREREVAKAWTENKYHGYGVRGARKPKNTALHGGLRLFATKLEGLTALRIAKEQEFAEMLVVIDQNIENARADSTADARRFKGVLLAPAMPEDVPPVYSLRLDAIPPRKPRAGKAKAPRRLP